MLSSPPLSVVTQPQSARSRWLGMVVLLVTLALAGCAGLPKEVDRPGSVALAAPGDTPLGKLVAARRAAEGARHA